MLLKNSSLLDDIWEGGWRSERHSEDMEVGHCSQVNKLGLIKYGQGNAHEKSAL